MTQDAAVEEEEEEEEDESHVRSQFSVRRHGSGPGERRVPLTAAGSTLYT